MSEDNEKNQNESQDQEGALLSPNSKTKAPSFYQVLILNDDFTPQEYVIHVLQKFFNKQEQEAAKLMLDVHKKGKGIAGVYPFEIAETKTFQVNEYSRQSKYPLKCVVEKI